MAIQGMLYFNILKWATQPSHFTFLWKVGSTSNAFNTLSLSGKFKSNKWLIKIRTLILFLEQNTGQYIITDMFACKWQMF